MFGTSDQGGYSVLAQSDDNHDGVIDANDAIWSELQIWQDLNGDGVTQAGELKSMAEEGLITLNLAHTPLDVTTPQGTQLPSVGQVTFADGRTSHMFEAIFDTSSSDTRYAGETGLPAWQSNVDVDVRGFGLLTDLSIAMSNDIGFGQLVASTVAAMTTPDMRVLLQQAGAVLGQWGEMLSRTEELTPVLVRTDAGGHVTLLDRADYVEDSSGGYWTLHSGAPVLGAGGMAIARPTMQDVLAQAASGGATWQLEQTWSPTSRATAVQHRAEAPYLVQIVSGRAVVLDYGIQNGDGSWRLASGAAVLDSGGNVIASPTRADITAQAHPAGEEWRTETIGFNPLANVPVERIGVNFVNNLVVDYTVKVTDRDGTFYVWARNLDRALALQEKDGDAREFNLRGYAVDFDTLDEVNSTDNSAFRVEMLTPAQFNFATSLAGVAFRPEMLTAADDNAVTGTGRIAYTINDLGAAQTATDSHMSDIQIMIGMLQPVMEHYIVTSRRFTVRMALQGGLKEFAQGIDYDVALDKYVPTTDRQLAPMFEAIFAAAPTDNANDAILDYLTKWNEVLGQVYPDYQPTGKDNLYGATAAVDQAFILQMAIEAFETVGVNFDIRGVAHALGVDETRIVTDDGGTAVVNGTAGADYLYMATGNHTYQGGDGGDYYFVGRNGGQDTIIDYGRGEPNELVFTSAMSSDLVATRDGQDMVVQITSTGEIIRLKDQFLGELNARYSDGVQATSGVDTMLFADGVIWDRFRMAFMVAHPAATSDAIYGTGAADAMWGGAGNDYLSGSAGGDIYIYTPGDGQDVIDDQGAFSFGPIKAGNDTLSFQGGINANNLKLIRDGESGNLKIVLLDNDGNATGDTIEIVGQFAGVKTGIGLFSEQLGGSDGLDYVAPNLIERFSFDDGSSLDFKEIVEQVIANARTTGDDAIFGMLNANTLDGGAGDDFLSGKEGDDTYLFGQGYGRDVIIDNAIPGLFDPPQHDKLKFIDGIRWTDLDFLRDGPSDTLRMRITGTTDEVVLQDFLATVPILGFINIIEDIVFGDGTTWTGFKLAQHYIDIAKTGGNDTIYGYDELSDFIDGGAGDDRLIGFGGNDVYQVALGEGNDTIVDSSGNDQLIFAGIASGDVDFSRTALDLIVTVRATGQRFVLENQYVRDDQQTDAVENLVFTDRTVSFLDVNPEDIDLVGTNGDDVITGSNFAETLDGRAGNDTLIGGDGGDTYKFDAGYGQDVIIDRRVRASWSDRRGVRVPVDDVVQFGGGISRDNVVFTKDGIDLLISITGRTDTLRIRNQFRDAEDGVELFRFYDGSTIKISDVEELLQIAGGNRGDNTITGLLEQENVLDGRQGDDTLTGGNRADTYAFSAGYGFDRIIERPDAAGIIDRVVFGASVRFEDIIVRRNGNDLVIDLGSGLDVLTIVNGLSTTRVEQFEFADGRILNVEAIIDRMLTGTAGDDHLIGFDNRDDTLSGGAGSDALEGGLGNDTYKFAIGDGSDSVYDTGGIDKVVFGEGITSDLVKFRNIDGDLVITIGNGTDRLAILSGYSAKPVESFVFADGTTLSIEQVRGIIRDGLPNAGQDLVDLRELPTDSALRPGTGHDHLILAQDSRVAIGALEGIDSVEMPSGVTHATVVLEAYASTDAVVRRAAVDSTDLIVAFASGSQLVVKGALGSGSLPNIEFANGVVWDATALVQAAITGQASAGNDTIVGSSRADSLSGGAGDDALNGGAGDDSYSFARGDGRDVIDDTAGNDTLGITGYLPGELRVSQIDPARNELVLSFAGSADQIVLRYPGGWSGVDTVRFSDGTIFTLDQLRDMAAAGTGQDDRITGSARNEIFNGAGGDDVIIGGGGDDIYRFGRGDGQDRIESNGSADGKGTLAFAAGIALEDIIASRDADGNIVLSIQGTDDRITLVDPPGDIDPVIAKVVFADGRSLNYRALAASVVSTDRDDHIIVPADIATPDIGSAIFGGLGNDHVEGGRGADVITGGKGDDLLEGGSGADTYYFARGDGQDTISDVEATDPSKVDKVHFAAGILPSDIRILSVGPNDLVIGIAGSDDRLTLKDMFRAGTATTDYGVERFEFADGTVWQLADIYSHAAASTGTGADTIDFGSQLNITAILDGGAGDDVLAGGIGDTTYNFGRGYGRDTIREGTNWASSNDTLRLASGIAPADVVVIRNGDDIVLRLLGSDDRLTIAGQAVASAPPIDVVHFNDGTQWNAAALLARALAPDAAERVLHPSNPATDPFADPVFAGANPGSGGGGTSASSTIGLALFETLSQPVGGLAVVGSATELGNGTYQLTPDSAFNAGAIWGSVDLSKKVVWTTKMFFGANEGGADGFSFAIQNNSAGAVTGAGGGGMGALVPGSFGIIFDTYGQTADFSQFVVNGQTEDDNFDPRHNFAQLEDAAWHDVVIAWDPATKTFSYSVDGTPIGSKSYDVVGSLFGGDSTVFYGFGAATGGATNDQRVQIISVASREGSGVDPSTVGTIEQIGSGLFARELAGAAARNTYNVFVPLARWGEGVDIITNFKSGDAGDILNIAIADGLPGTLLARAAGADTLIYFAGQGAQSFADARLLLRLNDVSPASLSDVNFAGAAFSVVTDQTVDGTNAVDLLQGGWANDTLLGHFGADRIIGGSGNDVLKGGGDDDTYVFRRGDGQDVITDRRDDYDFISGGDHDAIEFGPGITFDQLRFSTAGNDLIIKIAGTDDQISIVNGFRNLNYRIETLRFADGSTKSYDAITQVLATGGDGDDIVVDDIGASLVTGGAGDDNISAYFGNDRVIGGTGNDTLRGGGDDDVYVFNRGDGVDTIIDRRDDYDFITGGNDAIEFGAGISWTDLSFAVSGNDLTIAIASSADRIKIVNGFRNANYRIEELRFADGSVKTYNAILDVLSTGGAGDDTLVDDTRAGVLTGGAGNDVISAYWGNDRIIGGRGDDTILGGGDDDVYVFNRGDGQDTITDRREDYDFISGGNDAIEFGAGIGWDDLTLSAAGNDLVIRINGTEDRLRIVNGFTNANFTNVNYRVEELHFADGSVKTFADMQARIAATDLNGITAWGVATGNGIVGSDAAELLDASAYAVGVTLDGRGGYDNLTGSTYADVLTGGAGNDVLSGGAGADTYRFSAGFGQDVIQEYYWDGTNNIIQFDASLSIDDFVLEAYVWNYGNGYYDFGQARLRFVGSDDQISIGDLDAIEQIRFADGTVLGRQQMADRAVSYYDNDRYFSASDFPSADVLTGTAKDDYLDGLGNGDTLNGAAGDDLLYGGSGDDVLVGGTGDDYLSGGNGADVYRFSAGFGHDGISTGETGLDWIEFDSSITAADIALNRPYDRWEGGGLTDDLVIRVKGTDDAIDIRYALSAEPYQDIAGIRFADGTVWTMADIVAAAVPMPGINVTGGLERHAHWHGRHRLPVWRGRQRQPCRRGGRRRPLGRGGRRHPRWRRGQRLSRRRRRLGHLSLLCWFRQRLRR